MKKPKPLGASSEPPEQTAPLRPRPGEVRRERMAQGFTDIVGVLMRDPGFRILRLADLEWLVLPAVLSGQWRVARGAATQSAATSAGKGTDAGTKGNLLIPVATALWASVSTQIDKTLCENLDKPLTLRPNEWVSGNHLWLIAVAGDRRYTPKFLQSLAESDFKGKTVKMRVNGPDGKVVVRTLGEGTIQPPGAPPS